MKDIAAFQLSIFISTPFCHTGTGTADGTTDVTTDVTTGGTTDGITGVPTAAPMIHQLFPISFSITAMHLLNIQK